MKYSILYIPGLGDYYDAGRSFALKGWRLYGVKPRFIPVRWYDGGTYQNKLQLVKDAVKNASRDGGKLILIGESAGASLALNAAALLPEVDKVILIAGVNSPSQSIGPGVRKRSPSFVESSEALADSLLRTDPLKVHTVHGLTDRIVSPRLNMVTGARDHTFWTVGHVLTIVLSLTLLSPLVMRIIWSR